MKSSVTVKQPEGEAEIPCEILATEIVKIGNAMRAMAKSRLRREAVVILVHAACKGEVNRSTITRILLVLDDLERLYLRPKKQP